MENSNNLPKKSVRNIRRKSETRGNSQNDIFEINKKILALFDSEYEELPELEKRRNNLEKIIENGEVYEKIFAKEELKGVNIKIQLISSGIREAQYIFKTEPILKEYSDIINQPIKIDFLTNKKITNNSKKDILMINYLNIAKNYIEIDPIVSKTNDLWCSNCSLDLQQADDQLFVCNKCGYSVRNLTTITNYQDNSRINSTQRYVYERKANFINSMKEFQGTQNTTIQDRVKLDLQDQINAHNISKDKLTKDHLYEFLKLTNHTENYKDVNLLYTEFTNNPSPNIEYLEVELISMFDQVDEVYQRLKSPDRLNFLNGQFVLFKFLQKLRYPCKEEDFYILKTRDKILEHDEIWKKICEELQWSFIPTV